MAFTPAASRFRFIARSAAQTRILDAALQLIGENGVGGTSLQMIADTIGVTKAAVYQVNSMTAQQHSFPITVTVIALSAVKARLIIRNFMEVRTAPLWLRRATDAWLVVLWTAVLVIYLF